MNWPLLVSGVLLALIVVRNALAVRNYDRDKK